jgi:hypothetical protein
MLLDYKMADCQTEAVPLWLGGKVGIENFVDDFWWDARAGILNGDVDKSTLAQTKRQGRLVRAFDIGAGNLDATTLWHGLFGIENDVVNHLANLAAVSIDQPEIVSNTVFAGDRRAVQDKICGIPY